MIKTKLDMLKKIFEDVEIPFKFFGTKAIMTMEKDRTAEVTFHQGASSGNYKGLQVSIVNNMTGKVTGNVFNFEQYLGKNADRTHRNAKGVRGMYVWDEGGYDWYIVRPTSTEPILDAICEYILTYQ